MWLNSHKTGKIPVLGKPTHVLVFAAQVSRVYPLETSVVMSYSNRHVVRTNVNKQNKTEKHFLVNIVRMIKQTPDLAFY